MIFEVPKGYESLCEVLGEAVEQASKGKGKERHASEGEAYENQIICEVARRVGLGYPLGQAVKKIYESQRIGGERGVAELLGALNYVAAAVIVMKEKAGERSAPKDGDELVVLWKHKPEPEPEPKFKPGDKVQFRVTHPSVSDCLWVDGTYARYDRGNVFPHAVYNDAGLEENVRDEDIRPAPKAEGVEELVVSPFDAPQTKEELYSKILESNPATFKPRTPTGEELAEMAEGDVK